MRVRSIVFFSSKLVNKGRRLIRHVLPELRVYAFCSLELIVLFTSKFWWIRTFWYIKWSELYFIVGCVFPFWTNLCQCRVLMLLPGILQIQLGFSTIADSVRRCSCTMLLVSISYYNKIKDTICQFNVFINQSFLLLIIAAVHLRLRLYERQQDRHLISTKSIQNRTINSCHLTFGSKT